MSGGLLDNLTQIVRVQRELGCDFEAARQIVKAANEVDLDPPSSVVHVDFVSRKITDG